MESRLCLTEKSDLINPVLGSVLGGRGSCSFLEGFGKVAQAGKTAGVSNFCDGKGSIQKQLLGLSDPEIQNELPRGGFVFGEK